MSANHASLIEAAYRLDSDNQAWLSGVASAAHLAVDEGVCAYAYDASSDRVEVQSTAIAGLPESLLKTLLLPVFGSPETRRDAARVHQKHTAGLMLRALERSATRAEARLAPTTRAALLQNGYQDVLAVNARQDQHHGVMLLSPVRAETSPSARTPRSWLRIAAHVTAGLRLRGHWRRQTAIPAPEGSVAPGNGSEPVGGQNGLQRAAMRGAVLEIERARHSQPGKSAPVDAAAWPLLVSCEWSLVDQFSHQGAHYYIAHRSRPPASQHPSLGEREALVTHFVALGHSNKLIGYELGISASTVSTHLRTVMTKLGVTSRAELIRLLARP